MKTLRLLLATTVLALPLSAAAQEVIPLTVASSHPTTIPWVGMIQSHFMARTDEILARTGTYKIEWNEAFGGTLYRANATLSSVEEGITDVGWVFSLLEGAKLPLSQVSSYAPFATANPPAQLTTMWELYQSVPEFRQEWEQYNLVVLGLTGTDSYDLYTKDPVATFADLAGRKISAPGVLGTWLRGTGANAVDGSLTTYYTDIQTGVSDGTLSLALGVLPAKIYEVAPYVTRLNLGTVFSGAIAVNKDSWDGLPEEVQAAMTEAGQYYTAAHAEDLLTRQEAALAAIDEAGGTIFELPAEERAKWVDGLPNIAAEWVQAQDAAGRPGTAFLTAYMDGLRAKGETPSRDWDKLD